MKKPFYFLSSHENSLEFTLVLPFNEKNDDFSAIFMSIRAKIVDGELKDDGYGLDAVMRWRDFCQDPYKNLTNPFPDIAQTKILGSIYETNIYQQNSINFLRLALEDFSKSYPLNNIDWSNNRFTISKQEFLDFFTLQSYKVSEKFIQRIESPFQFRKTPAQYDKINRFQFLDAFQTIEKIMNYYTLEKNLSSKALKNKIKI